MDTYTNLQSTPQRLNMKTPKFHYFLAFLLTSSLFHVSSSKSQHYLKRGSSLSVSHPSDTITSLDNTFTCGFYGIAGQNAYWFAIWYTDSKDKTVIWTANRDMPVNGHGSKISLEKDGAMVLLDVNGGLVWQTNTFSTHADRAELLDSGNLVLKDSRGEILWQSFDFPTDTLLPTQIFTKSKRLVSASRKQLFSSGYYNFYFDSDNVLRLIYDGPEVTSIYWPNPDFSPWQNRRTVFNSTRTAALDDNGRFRSSDLFHFNASDMSLGIKRRLKLDSDGNLRLYSLNMSSGLWSVSWSAVAQQCNIHGLCGRYGICAYTPTAACSCPPGYEVRNPGNWGEGCKTTFKKNCDLKAKTRVKFVTIPNADYYGFDLNFSSPISLESCKKICLDDCDCSAFVYRLTGEGTCYTKGTLFNGYQSSSFPGTVYLKLPYNLQSEDSVYLNGSAVECGSVKSTSLISSPSLYFTLRKGPKLVYLYSFASVIGAIEIVLIFLSWWFLFRKNDVQTSLENGYRVISSQFRGFTYKEMKKATENFKVELGRGGSGAVYKGVLADERVVAVKRLGDVMFPKEEEFWAEVSTIGKINHMNLVRMWGFCSEGKHRLLVYEYVHNSSLDKHLFFDENVLGWEERFKVALGTAKGLAYLHHECLEWVIHCDVKPENILLGDDFESKIADFGLAKLSQRGGAEYEVTRIRGTKGYMAPEWALNQPITAKVDVYGYGVVVLELVKGIRLSSYAVEDSDEQVTELTKFVNFAKTKSQNGERSWVEEIVDPRLKGGFSRNQAATLTEIGLSCVQDDRNKRPTMESVVQQILDCQAEEIRHLCT